MKTHHFTLTANEEEGRAVLGNHLYVEEAAGPIRVKVIGGGVAAELKQGKGFTLPDSFSHITVYDLSGAINKVKLQIGFGKFEDKELAGTVSASISQSASIANEAAASVGIAAAKVLDAVAGRRAIHFRNTSANNIYLGASGVTVATAGIWLAPGEEHREEAAAAAEWHAIADGAASAMAMLSIN